MNVIFLDFDGTIEGYGYDSDEETEKRIKLLSEICHKYNAKVVIESAHKSAIEIEDGHVTSDVKWIKQILDLFVKYDIECIGITPTVKKYTNSDRRSYHPVWKEYEILVYLMRHPEIEHFCILDDDDARYMCSVSDLKRLYDYLVCVDTRYNSKKEALGLQEEHIPMVGEVLKKENKVRRLLLKYKKTLNK
jgi:hypothetical protein